MCIQLPGPLCTLGRCVLSYPQCVLVENAGQVAGSSSGSLPGDTAGADRQPQRPEMQSQTNATPASRRTSTTQSSRDAEYSASRLIAITSYQGRWKAVTNSQARLRASAGVTAGRSGSRSGRRSTASTATAANSRYATSSRCGGTLVTLNWV